MVAGKRSRVKQKGEIGGLGIKEKSVVIRIEDIPEPKEIRLKF
jgi:hypothetical protein